MLLSFFSLCFPVFSYFVFSFFVCSSGQRTKRKRRRKKESDSQSESSLSSSHFLMCTRPLFLEPVYAASLSLALFFNPSHAVSFPSQRPLSFSLSLTPIRSYNSVYLGSAQPQPPTSQPPRAAGIVLFQG